MTAQTAKRQAVAPEKGNLLSVVRQARSQNLIVYFNSYGAENRPGKQPDRPFGTKLQNYRHVTSYDAHAIWFVEDKASWYIEHQDQILDVIARYINKHDIAVIKMVGSSAGGYAAIRSGFLLDEYLRHRGRSATILSYGVNPQTGFRADLFERIEKMANETRWKGMLGSDPVVLRQDYRDAFDHLKIDLVDLMQMHQPRNFGIILIHDSLNPIDQTFAGDLAAINFVLQLPIPLGLDHWRGAARIMESELWTIFDQAMPFSKLDGELGELSLLV